MQEIYGITSNAEMVMCIELVYHQAFRCHISISLIYPLGVHWQYGPFHSNMYTLLITTHHLH